MTLHYTSGGGIDSNGQYSAGAAGFNMADVSSVSELNSLPDGVKGLVWLDSAQGVTDSFIQQVSAYANNSKLWGFYLADEPDPTGQWGTKVSAADLKAESDYIHNNLPGAKTFITMMDMGSSSNPDFTNTYNPSNSHIDYYGLDPYPVRTGSGTPDYSMIDKTVAAAQKSGIPLDSIVPVYQAFGGGNWTTDTGGKYVVPTTDQAQTMIDQWGKVVSNPAFDYAYSWNSQNGDTALSSQTDLQKVFLAHNTGSTDTASSGTTAPTTPVTPTTPTAPVTDPSTGTGTGADASTGTGGSSSGGSSSGGSSVVVTDPATPTTPVVTDPSTGSAGSTDTSGSTGTVAQGHGGHSGGSWSGGHSWFNQAGSSSQDTTGGHDSFHFNQIAQSMHHWDHHG